MQFYKEIKAECDNLRIMNNKLYRYTNADLKICQYLCCSYENNMLLNMLKISLPFKKFTNFMGK